jgi:hypothetical protein
MVDVSLIAGIIIIVVAVVTLIRIIKQLLEGVIIIVLVIVGAALIFHSSPIIGVPNFNIPISIGPNIVGVNSGSGNTTDVAIFNAYTFNIGGFTATLNGKSISVLNGGLSIPAARFGVIVLNSSASGEISVTGSTQIFGFNLGSLTSSYNYTK